MVPPRLYSPLSLKALEWESCFLKLMTSAAHLRWRSLGRPLRVFHLNPSKRSDHLQFIPHRLIQGDSGRFFWGHLIVDFGVVPFVLWCQNEGEKKKGQIFYPLM